MTNYPLKSPFLAIRVKNGTRARPKICRKILKKITMYLMTIRTILDHETIRFQKFSETRPPYSAPHSPPQSDPSLIPSLSPLTQTPHLLSHFPVKVNLKAPGGNLELQITPYDPGSISPAPPRPSCGPHLT